jgi:hypothetical protein
VISHCAMDRRATTMGHRVCECSGGDTVGVVGHTHCVHVYAHYITRAAARTLMILRTNRFCTVSLDSPVYFVCTRD